MYVNSTVSSDTIAVFGGWVTFVCVPAEVWIFLVVFQHEVVSGGFGQYGSCSYIEVFPISSNDTVVGSVFIGLEFISVYENSFGLNCHGGYGKLHGFYGSI